MKSAGATRFCCRSPLPNLKQLTPMFLTLILQYLNKLIEPKIGDLTSPQAFHSVKVQSFNGNRIILLTEFGSELPLKVFTLVRYFPIQACDLSYAPPPPVRTFLFATQCFVERSKFVQGVFQRFWVLFFLTRAQRQICVFHTEVCPDTFTRRWQRFRFYKVGYDIKPIITAVISFYRDTTDSPFKLTVFMERIRHFVMSPFTVIPFSEIEGEAILIQSPTRLFQCEGFELRFPFDLRSTTKFFEKTDIRLINAPQLLLDRLTRQRFPMRVCRLFQIGYVKAHCSITRIRQPALISLTLPLMEILVDLPHIIKQVAKPNTIGLIIKPIFVGFQGISHITPLTPLKWVGRHTIKRLCFNCLPV